MTSGLDGRFALITEIEGRLSVSIHETVEELDAAVADAEEEYGAYFDADEGSMIDHAILVPRSTSTNMVTRPKITVLPFTVDGTDTWSEEK